MNTVKAVQDDDVNGVLALLLFTRRYRVGSCC